MWDSFLWLLIRKAEHGNEICYFIKAMDYLNKQLLSSKFSKIFDCFFGFRKSSNSLKIIVFLIYVLNLFN
jgi:hypothetical protein